MLRAFSFQSNEMKRRKKRTCAPLSWARQVINKMHYSYSLLSFDAKRSTHNSTTSKGSNEYCLYARRAKNATDTLSNPSHTNKTSERRCLRPITFHIVSLHKLVEYIDTQKNSILWKKILSSLFQRFLFYVSSNVKLCYCCFLLCIFEAHHTSSERCSQIRMHKIEDAAHIKWCIIHVDALISAVNVVRVEESVAYVALYWYCWSLCQEWLAGSLQNSERVTCTHMHTA